MRFRRIKIIFFFLVLFLTMLQNQKSILGREKPEINSPEINNPSETGYSPTDFYVWEDRLYLRKGEAIYQYNISDKYNPVFMNHIFVEDVNIYPFYFKDKLITVFVDYISEKDETELTIKKYDLDNSDNFDLLTTKEVTVPIRVGSGLVNVLADYIVQVGEYFATSNFKKIIYNIPINESGFFIFPEGVANDLENRLSFRSSIYEENFLYIPSHNRDTGSEKLLIIDMSNIALPILCGNCTINEEDIYTGAFKKTQDIVYFWTYTAEYYAVNVSNKFHPFLIGNSTLPFEQVDGRKVCNSFVLTFEYRTSIDIYNFTSFESFSLINSYNLSKTNAYTFDAFPNIIVLDCNIMEVMLLDWSNPYNITLLVIFLPHQIDRINFNPFLMFPSIFLLFYFIKKRRKKEN